MSFVLALLGASVAVVVFAIAVYAFVPARALRVPAVLISTCGGIGLGVALGMGATIFYGDSLEAGLLHDSGAPAGAPAAPAGSMAPAAPGAGARAGTAKAGSSRGQGAGGGFGGANAKLQLAAFVAKLDQLTRSPLTVTLTDDQRLKVRRHLQGLADLRSLSTDDARTRLDSLLDVVKDQRETLEAAGYRWPGAGAGFSIVQDTPNPFAAGKNREHLLGLESTLQVPERNP